MKRYRAAVIGCGRMGGFIDNELAGARGFPLPHSHGAGFFACDRTDLVACADLRPEIMAEFGKRYDIPPERQYADYRQMIDHERPEIVSVATQPEDRAAIIVYAADMRHGTRARAIYAEKPLAASLAEADAIVTAIERNGVAFNMGTNRRWHPGFEIMRRMLDAGELGPLQSLIAYQAGTLFNTGSHAIDTLLWLHADAPVAWVQAHLPGGAAIQGELLPEDPPGHGIIGFEDGVTGYLLNTARGSEYEAIGARGTVASLNNAADWEVRRAVPERRGEFERSSFPSYAPASSTLRLIEDLVHTLDTGAPPRGGVQVARRNTELIFACIESHRRGGARVALPLEGCNLRLQRTITSRQPKLA
jgi:predicted dehydrogenase